MKPIRTAIIGFGKIARDQHVPSMARLPRFELAATVSRQGAGVEGVPSFHDHRELLAGTKDMEAVAICTPPSVRYEIARDCIDAGLHLLLEKPPADTLGEIEEIACLAEAKGVTLFTTWHSQYNPAVDAAAEALARQRLQSMEIVWREDVRKWHPGQEWIWEPGGFGVFDPGINAFSIATKIVPGSLFVKTGELLFPENRQMPIAAELTFTSPAAAADIPVTLDWRHSGGEAWDIRIRTEDGRSIELREGGSRLFIDGEERASGGIGEYPMIYERFLDLIDRRESLVDLRPLRLVADAFLVAKRTPVEPFQS